MYVYVCIYILLPHTEGRMLVTQPAIKPVPPAVGVQSLFIYLINLFTYGCAESLWLLASFLWLLQAGATLWLCA